MSTLKFLSLMVFSVFLFTYSQENNNKNNENKNNFINFMKKVNNYRARNEKEDNEDFFGFNNNIDLSSLPIDLKISDLHKMAKELDATECEIFFEKILAQKSKNENFQNTFFSLLKEITKETTNEGALKVILAEKK